MSSFLNCRSIGLQVNLCQCTLALPGGNIPTGNSNIDALVLPTATTSNAEADKYKDKDTDDPEMASNVNEDEAVETDHLLAGESKRQSNKAYTGLMGNGGSMMTLITRPHDD